ncbi:hypothetical protein FA15DRAFT_671829 [Coprinopsis marcescibilis]|uniref:WW domain-containing protein n=1 Tax=Coprinopsis marcescibilis TaxID=230819 RepID=A0A5C3L1R7_COPMA|nr:hypothetical protein FA15DRAFT_671829 [Coprinopsis marcescibilis]
MKPKHPVSPMGILKLLLQGVSRCFKIPILTIVRLLQRIWRSWSASHSHSNGKRCADDIHDDSLRCCTSSTKATTTTTTTFLCSELPTQNSVIAPLVDQTQLVQGLPHGFGAGTCGEHVQDGDIALHDEDKACADPDYRKRTLRESSFSESTLHNGDGVDLDDPQGTLAAQGPGDAVIPVEDATILEGIGGGEVARLPDEDDVDDQVSDWIYPIMPSGNIRYERHAYIHLTPEPSRYCVKPMQIAFDDEYVLPEGWIKVVQPEGFPYFWHEQDRIITDSQIYDADVSKHLGGFITDIHEHLRIRNLVQTEDVDLVLQIVRCPEENGEEQWWCGYYFVNHSTRTIFWLEKFHIDEHLAEVKGKLQGSHIKVLMENEYWQHWILYPNLCRITSEVMTVTENALRDAIIDVITSEYTTVNISLECLKDSEALVKETKAALPKGYFKRGNKRGPRYREGDISTWCIGRIMKQIAFSRFLNFYGQSVCRLDPRNSVHKNKPKTPSETSMRFRCLSPALFCAPDVYYTLMEKLWVDKLTSPEFWNKLFAQLHEDWRDQLIYASLLLTTNIAFLTISNVTRQDEKIQGTLVQIPSYISTISSIGSIILGLLLKRQHRIKLKDGTASEIHSFIAKRYHKKRGFESLAVMYSLPYALLMWGITTFLASFMAMCLYEMTNSARYISIACFLILSGLIGWYIHMSWDKNTDRWSSLYISFWEKIKKEGKELMPHQQGQEANDDTGATTMSDEDEEGSYAKSIVSRRSNVALWRKWWRRQRGKRSQPTLSDDQSSTSIRAM